MGKGKPPMNRALLYSLTPEKGFVGGHVVHMLKALRTRYDFIAVALNGAVSPVAAEELRACADLILPGPSVAKIDSVYRVGLDRLGWDRAAGFDELTVMSCDLFGPVFPVDEMFAVMDADTEADLWGLAEAAPIDPTVNPGTPDATTYLDQSFITFRKRLLQSSDFRSLWSTAIPTLRQGVEQRSDFDQAQFLAKKGYRSNAFLQRANFLTHQPLFLEIPTALRSHRLPFLRFSPFCRSPLYQDEFPANLNRVLPLLSKVSDYPQDLFWQSALRKGSLRTLHTNLAYQFTFDSTTYGAVPKWDQNLRIAVCAHVYYPDVLAEILECTRNIPTAFDMFITTASTENKAIIEARCAEAGLTADVRVVQQNRGRDMSAFFIDLKDVVTEGGYDLICRLHSKRSPQVNPSTGNYFKQFIFDSVLASPAYTSHLLDFLVAHPHVGMAFAPMIHTGYATMGQAWFKNREIFAQILKDMDCTVQDEPYSPIAAFGTVYWFRPEALRPFFEGQYGYEDYNQEPNHTDGGLAHGQERALTYVAQARGYMTATVWPDYVAAQSSTLMEYKMDSLYTHIKSGYTAPHGKLMSLLKNKKLEAVLGKSRLVPTPDFLRNFEKRNRPKIKRLGKLLRIAQEQK
jgi:lipopolysaccharide biosynthesis protein